MVSHISKLLKELGLKFRIVTASDPFFSSGAEAKRIYQSALALKLEIQVFLVLHIQKLTIHTLLITKFM